MCYGDPEFQLTQEDAYALDEMAKKAAQNLYLYPPGSDPIPLVEPFEMPELRAGKILEDSFPTCWPGHSMFAKTGEKVPEVHTKYKTLREAFPDATNKDVVQRSVWSMFEEPLEENLDLIPQPEVDDRVIANIFRKHEVLRHVKHGYPRKVEPDDEFVDYDDDEDLEPFIMPPPEIRLKSQIRKVEESLPEHISYLLSDKEIAGLGGDPAEYGCPEPPKSFPQQNFSADASATPSTPARPVSGFPDTTPAKFSAEVALRPPAPPEKMTTERMLYGPYGPPHQPVPLDKQWPWGDPSKGLPQPTGPGRGIAKLPKRACEGCGVKLPQGPVELRHKFFYCHGHRLHVPLAQQGSVNEI